MNSRPRRHLNGSSRLARSGPGQELVMNESSKHGFRRIVTVSQHSEGQLEHGE